MRKFINILILTIALVGSVSAQSLDDISKKVYDLSIEAINKGMNRMSAYEEYLEKQELEAAKKAEEEALEAKEAEDDKFVENCKILTNAAILYPLKHDAWVICYCDPIGDYIWYTLFVGDDGDLWINLRYDDSGELGDLFYSTKNERLDYTKAIDDMSGKETAAIKLINTAGYIVVIQDIYEPRAFDITW